MRLCAVVLVTICVLVGQASSADQRGTAVPIMVELFTSEGCSSCPPADAWLDQIDKSQPVPDAHLVVLSEHVDYWDHEGWKDPFSSAALTDRQNAYAHKLGLATVYTPQIIVDGTRELSLNDSQQVTQVFQKALAAPKIPVGITLTNTDASPAGVGQAHVEVDGRSLQHDADVYLAIAFDHADTQVLRGENKGRDLSYVAVVQSLTKLGKLQKGKNFDQHVPMKLRRDEDPKNLRVIVFVQASGPGEFLGAASVRPFDKQSP